MKVTFLLGNGFDKAIGLKTSYNDFYEWYLEQEPELDDIQKLKKQIEEKRFDKWSDFEIALGQFTKEFENPNEFISCFKLARESLMIYLKKEYAEKNVNSKDFLLSSAYRLVELSEMFYKDFDQETKEKFENIGNEENCLIRFISFNYTPLLDDAKDDMMNSVNSLWNNKYPSTKCEIGDYINVHGLYDDEPILGVNDISQIANESFRKNSDIVKLMIKREADKQVNRGRIEKALNIIEDSDIVCTFGLSLGDTDLFYWEQLACWLEKRSNRILIIYNKQNDKKSITELQEEYKDKIAKFLIDKLQNSRIIVDLKEKKMTVKFAEMEATEIIKSISYCVVNVVQTDEFRKLYGDKYQ